MNVEQSSRESTSRVYERIRTPEQAEKHIQLVRWGENPICPYCESTRVGEHTSSEDRRARFQCYSCKRAFGVTIGTIFQGTHIPLDKWITLASLILNGGPLPNTSELARYLDLRRQTVTAMIKKIKEGLGDEQTRSFLVKIVGDDQGGIV